MRWRLEPGRLLLWSLWPKQFAPFTARQHMRACVRGVFASATRTSRGGLRSIIRASQGSAPVVLRALHRTTLLAPMISNRLSERSPIFVVAPRRCLPPVECYRGTRPSQAAKSRPRRNVSGGGARATSAVAMRGPMPGTVISRRAISLSRARRAISVSSPRIWLFNRVSISINPLRQACAASGIAVSQSSTISTSLRMLRAPAEPRDPALRGGLAGH